MANLESLTSEELLRVEAQSWNLGSIIHAASIHCAAQLGIPNIMHKHGKPMTIPELLAALPISPSKASYLHRLLRVLVHSGFLLLQKPDTEQGQEEEKILGYYSLTPAGLLLQTYGRLKALNKDSDDPYLLKAWTSLGAWFQNEEPTPFSTAYGENFWDFFARQQNSGDAFNENMAQDSKLMAKVLLDKCKHVFEGLTTLIDVGGGTGTIAKALAKSFPKLECTVFDRPQVVANLRTSLDNLNFVAGDMFDKIPPANVVLLKWILHDWTDEECVKILKNCKEAIPGREEGGKVIIIDMVLGCPGLESEFVQAQILLDMLMMVNFGSKERNKDEWEKLFLAAGFSDYKINHALGSRSLIELYP